MSSFELVSPVEKEHENLKRSSLLDGAHPISKPEHILCRIVSIRGNNPRHAVIIWIADIVQVAEGDVSLDMSTNAFKGHTRGSGYFAKGQSSPPHALTLNQQRSLRAT